ncbi:MAG: GAF and ANTAR domain-containing protein [Actinobacteria bacterium]|nr:GAF and ANTAR domain-containing protein [Actinomycetota bacterium]
MSDTARLRTLVSEYARTTLGRYEIGEVLYRLTDHALPFLGSDGAGVSLGDGDGDLRFVTATDDQVVRVEEKQVQSQSGPCHEAFRTGKPTVVDDLRDIDDPRWGDYPAFAIAQGCRSVLGIPMFADGRTIGALNVYRHDAGPWDETTVDDAQLIADMASAYVVNDRTLAESRLLADQLQNALDSRVVIEQAKGILSERHGTDVAAAFQRLRAHARQTNQRLHAVAQAVVDGEVEL